MLTEIVLPLSKTPEICRHAVSQVFFSLWHFKYCIMFYIRTGEIHHRHGIMLFSLFLNKSFIIFKQVSSHFEAITQNTLWNCYTHVNTDIYAHALFVRGSEANRLMFLKHHLISGHYDQKLMSLSQNLIFRWETCHISGSCIMEGLYDNICPSFLYLCETI